jgi:imidazoleglycerol-phosphate dehydratase
MTNRTAQLQRATSESSIELSLDLDGTGASDIHTSVPFYDHLLTAFAKHSLTDLTVRASGDTDIDVHHTVEDVAIVLGQAIKKALGDKAGISRYGDALVPLDEALVQAVVDISGRPYLVYEVDPGRERIGTFDPQLMEEFWRAFVHAADVTLHVRMVAGRNAHHIVEASTKGVARALRDAVKVEGTAVPSTKGTLSG